MGEIHLTEGSIFKKLVQFSLPMIAGNLLQQVYNLVDTLIVGKCIGSDALAAVGSAYTLMTFLTSILIGLCMGSGAFFSADYGAGEEAQLGEDIRLSFGFILAMCALIYAIIYPGMELILSLLQTPPELLELTRNYVRPVFTGIFFVFLYNFYAYLQRAMGNSLIPLVFLGISALLNIALDLWFVLGFHMGVAGAAWATVIAQAVSGVGIALYTQRKLSLPKTKTKSRRLSRLRKIVVNDAATALQQSVMNFGILMIQGRGGKDRYHRLHARPGIRQRLLSLRFPELRSPAAGTDSQGHPAVLPGVRNFLSGDLRSDFRPVPLAHGLFRGAGRNRHYRRRRPISAY